MWVLQQRHLHTMGGCASLLFLPFALCARDTDDADDQGHEPRPTTGRTNQSYERLQQPSISSTEALPLSAVSGLQTVDDAVLSAILMHIAVSDDDDGFAQLLRLKVRAALAEVCQPADPLRHSDELSIPSLALCRP